MGTFFKKILVFTVSISGLQQIQAFPEEAVATYGCSAGIAAGLISGIGIATITQDWSPPARYAALFIGCAGACAITNLTVSAACAELTPYGRLSRAHHAIHQIEHDEIMKRLSGEDKHIISNKALSLHLTKLHTIALNARRNLNHALDEAVSNKYPHGITKHCKQLIDQIDIILEKIAYLKTRAQTLA
ncbi:hypothetical protein FJ365_02460 [Candidatus Dependentiae bacterium]|nr:hypothetical protein [Candidatus Dependentiae bacterium]